MNQRPICQICQLRVCAINYHRAGRIYYRRRCELCVKKHSERRHSQPLWQQRGYEKKRRCERCGFHSDVSQVFAVYVVDGDLRNTTPVNLRTVCANCQIVITVTGLGWRRAELVSDF
jgi:hypothetical protein